MKIITIVGARPQFVKAAALSRELRSRKGFSEILVHTGQHFDDKMSAVFFQEMELQKPHYNLGIHSRSRGEMIAKMQPAIEEILRKEQPGFVLVYGDTNSTLAGARAAKALNIKLAHVEAGLRSFNPAMPEELNRVETDRLSDILFVPANVAAENLAKERIDSTRIFEVGDIMYDAIKYYSQKTKEKSSLLSGLIQKKYVLLTIHRQENTDDEKRLVRLMKAVDKIAKEVEVIFPCHPRTLRKLQEFGIETKAKLIEPVGYFDMISLTKNCQMVLTDSGGLQKEAFYLGKFCITLREETEWVELVEVGANKICGTVEGNISEAYNDFMGRPFAFQQQPYGDGRTAEKILNILGQQVD